MHRNTLVRCVLFSLLVTVVPGCSPRAAGPPDARTTAPPDGDAPRERDLVARGAAVVARNGCPTCHAPPDPADGTLSGQRTSQPGTHAYGANLTPDPDTGIGTWSDEEIARAITEGVDPFGDSLCGMPRFAALGGDDLAAAVAYLQSLPAVHREIPESDCLPEDVDVIDPPRDAIVPVDAIDSSPAAVDAGDDATADRDDAGFDAPAACLPRVRINEVQVAGAGGAGDEFVELYNASGCDVSLAGYALEYASATGTTASARWRGGIGDVLPAAGMALIAGAGYDGRAVFGRLSGSAGALASGGGGLGLVDGRGTVVDRVAYGLASTTSVAEGAPVEAPPAGSSIARHPDGADTDDNRADFTVGTPSPGAPN